MKRKKLSAALVIFVSLFSLRTEAKEISLREWKSLDTETQGRVLAQNGSEYSNIQELEFDIGSLSSPYKNVFTLAKKRGDSVVEQLEFEDNHARVGPATISFISIYLLEKQVIGLNIGHRFEGCDMPDETSPYFEDERSALDAGCEFSDVSWMWQGTFNDLGDLIYDPGYPEWTGY